MFYNAAGCRLSMSIFGSIKKRTTRLKPFKFQKVGLHFYDMKALECKNICKQFGKKIALNNLTLDLEEGRILGVLGPNGSGKTTFIRIIMNLLMQDSGKILVFGKDPRALENNYVSYLPEERGIYIKHDIWRYVKYIAQIKGLSGNNLYDEITRLTEELKFELPSSGTINTLSKGNQQKLQILISLLGNPKMTILDEPFSGLDPQSRSEVNKAIKKLSDNGSTIIIATHMLDQAESLCSDVLLIRNGVNVCSGSMSEIKKTHSSDHFLVGSLSNSKLSEFENHQVKVEYQKIKPPYNSMYSIRPIGNVTRHEIMNYLHSENFEIDYFEKDCPSLEEIYLESVSKEENEKHKE